LVCQWKDDLRWIENNDENRDLIVLMYTFVGLFMLWYDMLGCFSWQPCIVIGVAIGWFKEITVENKRIYCCNSIFFWATLYCFFTLHWILFGLRVKLLDTRLFFTREHLLTSVIAHGFVKFRCIHRQTAISKYRTILKLKLEFLQHLFSLIPLCRKDIVIDCGSMY